MYFFYLKQFTRNLLYVYYVENTKIIILKIHYKTYAIDQKIKRKSQMM